MKQDNKTSMISKVLQQVLRSFVDILPMLIATIGLVGLIQVYISPEILHAFFQGNLLGDTLIGTISGGVAVGQPIISYIIGGELLHVGVSYYAVTAFILSWVTLGLIQLPFEASTLGLRFTLVRNILAFVFTIIIALAVGLTLRVLA
jgi:uncharacterized membrane protein YraQ (UPF0718 family)